MRSRLAIALAVLGAVTPLREDQRGRLETAFDGRDHQEEAFAALLENVAEWTEGVGDAPVRLHPDYDALLENPDACRGELYRVAGAIQQQTPLAPPFAEASEWFLRAEDGRPILVYVFTGESVEGEPAALLRDGQDVMIIARFYKRVDAVARDGRTRSYPAFVGRFPVAVTSTAEVTGVGSIALLPFALVVGLLAVLIVLLLITRRQRSHPHRRAILEPERMLDDEGELPDDPAEALQALKKRARAGE